MYLCAESAAGVRFLASMREGRGLKPSARAAGVGKETGYRWLREAFVSRRELGVGVDEAQAQLGYRSPRVQDWECDRLTSCGDGRHHLALSVDVEALFWVRYLAGDSVENAGRAAGLSRSTAYRWLQRRFVTLREQGTSVRVTARQLRIAAAQRAAWEAERRRVNERTRQRTVSAETRAVRDSARHVESLMQPRQRTKVEAREQRYWELMRQGMTNTAACRLLGVNRRTGGRIRDRHKQQTARLAEQQRDSGRYLSLRERLQIADLLRLVCRCARSPPNSGAAPPRSNASWTATVTTRAATCHRALITPRDCSAAAGAHTSWSPTTGYGSSCSASSTAPGRRMRSAAGCA